MNAPTQPPSAPGRAGMNRRERIALAPRRGSQLVRRYVMPFVGFAVAAVLGVRLWGWHVQPGQPLDRRGGILAVEKAPPAAPRVQPPPAVVPAHSVHTALREDVATPATPDEPRQ